MNEKRQCPCCRYWTLEGEAGNYDICPVCFWEDDPVQRKDINFKGGANEVSLRKARRNFKKWGASEERFVSKVREPLPEEMEVKENE